MFGRRKARETHSRYHAVYLQGGYDRPPPLIRVLGGGVDLFGDLKSSIGPNYMKSKYDILLSIPDLIVEISSQKNRNF